MHIKLILGRENTFVYSVYSYSQKQYDALKGYFDKSKIQYHEDTREKSVRTLIIDIDPICIPDVLYSLSVLYAKSNWADWRAYWH